MKKNDTTICALSLAFLMILSPLRVAGQSPSPPPRAGILLEEWERGISFAPVSAPGMKMYLWFYEWTLFDALVPGQHSQGLYQNPRRVSPSEAWIEAPQLHLRIRASPDGADLELTATNRTDTSWPELAAIIPCFNPGPQGSRNEAFTDEQHVNTFFRGPAGFERLEQREIHFNARLKDLLRAVSHDLSFVFSQKWPTSDRDAVTGLLIRTSRDGAWVTGIAWEDFVSVQGHNPWMCMHHSVRVGPLAPGQASKIRGRVYLFKGSREDLWERHRRQFLDAGQGAGNR